MKRWFRFRLRSLLLFIFVCAIVAFWFRPSPPPPDHWLLDAEGAPLGWAKLEFFGLDDDGDALPKQAYSQTYTDAKGGFAWRKPPKPTRVAVRVFQQDCGHAMIRLSQHDVEQAAAGSANHSFRLPLAPPDSPYGQRSACGKVVVDGQPVEGAEIYCTSVRTPGDGLINGIHPMHHALTGSDGSFRLYLPNRPLPLETPIRRSWAQQRGELIPQNSRFDLSIRVPHDPTLFPLTQYVDNVKPTTIELQRVTQKYSIDFEPPAGGWPDGGSINDAEVQKYIGITYHQGRDANGYNHQFALPREVVTDGGFLIAGEYTASYRDTRGRSIHWQPLTVDRNSPANLRFKIPAPVVYSGRVLDGVTGEPVAGAFVGGWNGTSRKNLALLTPAEWTDLEQQPAQLSIGSKAVQPLRQLYSFQSIVRTDDDGRFQLTQNPEGEFYGVMAFARDRLPFAMGVYGFRKQLKKGPRVDTGDFLLFPAARLTVHPVVDATERPHVRPRWQPAEGDQPAWFPKFKSVVNEVEQRDFSTLDWLEPDILQPLLVPADLRFRMIFDCPYDDKWIAGNRPQVFQLAAGAEADFGELKFQPAAEVKVRVVGPDGTPVEGAPVRRLVEDGKMRGWSIAHNSDKDGFTTHHVPPNANVTLAVSHYSQKRSKRFEVAVEFKTEEYDPNKPPQIQLTKAQVEALIGVKQ